MDALRPWTGLSRACAGGNYCAPSGRYHVEDTGPECSIWLHVYFTDLDRDAGVYTTSLPGVLVFTIR